MEAWLVFVVVLSLGDVFDVSTALRISISARYPFVLRSRRGGLSGGRRYAKMFGSLQQTYLSQLQPVPPTAAPAQAAGQYSLYYPQSAASLQQPLSSVLPATFVQAPVTYHQPVTIYPAPAPSPVYQYSYAPQQVSSYTGRAVQYSYNEPLAGPMPSYVMGAAYQRKDRYDKGYRRRRRYDDSGYGDDNVQPSYGSRRRYDAGMERYDSGGYGGYDDEPDSGYGRRYDDDVSRYSDDYEDKKYKKKKKPKVIYVPVYKPRRKKKKMKIISIMPGFYIAGGTQLFGKYKTLKECEQACAATPSCFAGDYNPWLKKCYVHTNYTACETLRAHKKLVHFSKVPCQVPEAPTGLVTLGAQLFRAVEQRGIKSITDCLKLCATAGKGIPVSVIDINNQLCFGIDYDFGSHKCYFHVDNTNNRICPDDGSPPNTPRDLVANPAVVNIILCPGP